MAAFDDASTFDPVEPGLYRGELTEDWFQGRGAYGGLVGAILLRAMEAEGRGLPARTLHVTFCAPAEAGPSEVRTTVIRNGRSVMQLRSELLQNGRAVAAAMGTFARSRRATLRHDELQPRGLRPPSEVPPADESIYIPAFCRHITFRQAIGEDPFSGAETPLVGGWCRFNDPPRPDAAMLVGLIDAWPPAALCLAKEWMGAATIDMTVHFVHDGEPDLGADKHYELVASSSKVDQGYADDHATLFSEDGTLLAYAEQLVALFG